MGIARIAPVSYKVFLVKNLRQVTVIGLGLLGGSVALAVRQRMPGTVVVGYSHRPATRRKAKALGTVNEVASDVAGAVAGAELVILATPIFTFESYFAELSLEQGQPDAAWPRAWRSGAPVSD